MCFPDATSTFKYLTLFGILLKTWQLCSTQSSCLIIGGTKEIFGSIRWGTYRTDTAMNIFQDMSLLSCVKECQLRSHCEAAGYQRLYHKCQIYDARSSTPQTLVTKPGSVYVNMNLLHADQVYLGACGLSDCPTGYRCKATGDQKECDPSECPKPPDVANADIHFVSQAIGMRAKYTCMDGYSSLGKSVITCQTNLTWTNTSFGCFQCPRPPDVVNADIHFVSQAVGMNATYTCIDGYRSVGKSVITCQTNLTWTNTSFGCFQFKTLSGFNVEFVKIKLKMDFNTAEEYCTHFDGGRLVKIKSSVKNAALNLFFASGGYNYYIDAHYNVTTSTWTYSDGDILSDCCWEQGQPDNSVGNESCILARRVGGDFIWQDTDCSKEHRSICEIDI